MVKEKEVDDPRKVFERFLTPSCFGTWFKCETRYECSHSEDCSLKNLRDNLRILGTSLGKSTSQIEMEWQKFLKRYLERRKKDKEEQQRWETCF